MWKNIVINSNNVVTATDKAVLIKIPRSKLKFWHPAKLVRYKGKNNYLISIGYTDDFNFKLFRNGEGRHNQKEIIEELHLSAQEFEEYFTFSELNGRRS